ncbi:MAG: DUF2877 domain-containing protein [bacterium]|nr:DUF2877 domain-containing protein [bacterium]
MHAAALSIDGELRRALATATLRGRVHSVHRHAACLRPTAGDLIILAAGDAGNGPRFVLVDDSFPFERCLAPGAPFEADGRSIRADGAVVTLAGADAWRGALDIRAAADIAAVSRCIAAAGRAAAGGGSELLPLLGGAVPPGCQAAVCRAARPLADALARGDPAAAGRAARPLVGLGRGLTPSCDDMLVGVLGFLRGARLAGPPYARAGGLPRILSAVARAAREGAAGTTAVSAHFLRSAARGRFAERAGALLEAIFAGGEKRVEGAAGRLLRYGATSGADLICGVVVGAAGLRVPGRRRG